MKALAPHVIETFDALAFADRAPCSGASAAPSPFPRCPTPFPSGLS
jgi:hypothetical protein